MERKTCVEKLQTFGSGNNTYRGDEVRFKDMYNIGSLFGKRGRQKKPYQGRTGLSGRCYRTVRMEK
jgi:hypothetical protein